MGFFSGLEKGYKAFARQFEAASESAGGCVGWLLPWSIVAAVILGLILLIEFKCGSDSRRLMQASAAPVAADPTLDLQSPGRQAQAPLSSSVYEAEQASLNGAARLCTDHSGFSGTAFVCGYGPEGTGNSTTTFHVQVPAAGAFVVSLRYANSNSQPMTLSIYVNGVKARDTVLQPLPTWDSWSEQDEVLTLVSGTNEISYRYDWSDSGHVNLDQIRIRPR